TFGAGQASRFLVVLAIGTGVGGGIIRDGRLVRGEGGYGGELGHVPINFDGRACICGGQGCLKTYVSGTDIALVGTERLKRYVSARALESTQVEIAPQSKQSTVRGGAALVQYETERRRVGTR